MCSAEKSVSSGPGSGECRPRVSDHTHVTIIISVKTIQLKHVRMSDDESSIREFLCPSNIEMKSSDLMLWKFESANIYLSECGGKLPPLTLIFSSNTNIPQLHSLSFSSSRSVIWISSSENLFFLINIPNYPAAASRASHQSYCQQSMCRHWSALSGEDYSMIFMLFFRFCNNPRHFNILTKQSQPLSNIWLILRHQSLFA